MAATQERNTNQLAGDYFVLPLKAKAKIYAGTLVAIDATGHAIPATAGTDLTAAGRAEETVYNTDGDTKIVVARGVFIWDNDITDAVTQADVGQNCYLLDDETVTSKAEGHSVAGKVLAVTSDGVTVETR